MTVMVTIGTIGYTSKIYDNCGKQCPLPQLASRYCPAARAANLFCRSSIARALFASTRAFCSAVNVETVELL